ncbi:nuclear transport factor 2 family protein [Kitasatospora sp. LaBMicrA B282]|uniref:nuclear transport factor 2 family protein n=1 Tax=Kitasatospora sp. LaBMicrA B282 TaxID=3420949 RepID=UPI003D129454
MNGRHPTDEDRDLTGNRDLMNIQAHTDGLVLTNDRLPTHDRAPEQELRDRLDVVETCTRMCWHTDKREWDRLRTAVFTDRVLVDYTSLDGGRPVVTTVDELIGAWRALLGPLAATQHLLTNHLVELHGEHAVATADFQATHLLANALGGPLWTLGGHYRFTLRRTRAGWRIDGLTMTTTWADGNRHIMERTSTMGRNS